MQDVIFNGSTARKPGSRASVELIFDNSDGRAAGQWGQYGEIAVKRVLTRDGTSSYYINNRRAAATSIHLPRHRPRARVRDHRAGHDRPDHRGEAGRAARVPRGSRGRVEVQERRRETENRLHDTRENLTRVEDIVRELGANLESSRRRPSLPPSTRNSSPTARRSSACCGCCARTRPPASSRSSSARSNRRRSTSRRKRRSCARSKRSSRRCASRITRKRRDAGRAGPLYEANAEVSRLEAEIKFIVESRNRVQAQIAALNAQREQ